MVCYPVSPKVTAPTDVHSDKVMIKLCHPRTLKIRHLDAPGKERKWTNHLICGQWLQVVSNNVTPICQANQAALLSAGCQLRASSRNITQEICACVCVSVCVAPLITPRRTANDQQTTQSSTCLLRFFAKNVLLFLWLLWWQLWYLRWAGSPKKNNCKKRQAFEDVWSLQLVVCPIVGTCSLQNLTAKPCQVTAQRLATCTTNSALQAYGSSSFSIHTSRDPPHGTPSRKAALSGTFALDLHVLGPLEHEESIAYRFPMIPFRSPIDSPNHSQ